MGMCKIPMLAKSFKLQLKKVNCEHCLLSHKQLEDKTSRPQRKVRNIDQLRIRIAIFEGNNSFIAVGQFS